MPNADRRPEDRTPDAPYEAPEVESVLTPEELEREVQYAGTNGVTPA